MNSSTGQAAPPEMAYRSLDGIVTVPLLLCCTVAVSEPFFPLSPFILFRSVAQASS